MDGLQSRTLEVNDFSGGITDHYVNGRPNTAEEMDNLIVLPDKSALLRPGSELVDEDNGQIPAGNQRVGQLINYNNDEMLFVQSAKKFYYRAVTPGAYSTLQGPTSNDVLTAGTTSTYVSYAQWNRHLYVTDSAFSPVMRLFQDSGGTYRVYNAGLPELATTPTVTAGGVGTGTYGYAFHYFFTYTIGTEVFEDYGATTITSVSSCLAPNSSTVAISAIPVIANSTTDNYATTTIKVYIYRTIDGGSTYYKVGHVTNGTTTYNDTTSDADLTAGLLLYTDGGVLDNDPPPLAKYIHVCDKVMTYAHVKEGAVVYPNKYKISTEDDPDSVPGANESTVENEITGTSSASGTRIILTKAPIYRSEGKFDETGRGNLVDVRISDTAGCVSHRSIVQAEGKIFWAGNDGFYMSDGYQVMKISKHLNTTYKLWLSNVSDHRKIEGKYDQENKRIVWTVQDDASSLEVDFCVLLDLQWPITEESSFQTASNGDSWRPTSLEFFDGDMYRADSRGYVFRHDADLVTDPRVDTTATPSDWETKAIIYNYKGFASSLGTTMARKWVSQFVVNCKNRANVSIQVNAINDDGVILRPLKEIRWRRNFSWGDPDFIWGSDTCVWGPATLIKAKRRLPAGGLRLTYIQIQITNAYTVIQNSDTLGTATFDTSAKTATLDSAATFDWPADSVDYYLSQENDEYDTQLLVTTRAANVLTYSDTANASSSGSQKWLLKGYKKGEVINILSYGLLYAPLLSNTEMWTSSEGGENA
jgi:hypothetical protein